MLLDRGADLSSPGFMHPQTRNQRCKAQTFCYLSPSSVQSVAAESNLVSAMPRFMVSQPRLRCWLPLGSRKPGLGHRSRMRGPWCVVTLDPRSDPQACKWPQSLSSPWVGQHLPAPSYLVETGGPMSHGAETAQLSLWVFSTQCWDGRGKDWREAKGGNPGEPAESLESPFFDHFIPFFSPTISAL